MKTNRHIAKTTASAKHTAPLNTATDADTWLRTTAFARKPNFQKAEIWWQNLPAFEKGIVHDFIRALRRHSVLDGPAILKDFRHLDATFIRPLERLRRKERATQRATSFDA